MPPSEAKLAAFPVSQSDSRRPKPDTPPPREVIASVEGLVKLYANSRVLDGVSCEFEKGRIYSVIGPSGCGKTTLLRSLLGLTPVNEGAIRLFGTDIASATLRQLDQARLKIGVVFQSSALMSSMTAFENVELPLKRHTNKSQSEIRETVETMLELVGMQDAGDRRPSELSGGMRKRCALARAIALQPQLLLLDEPTSGADPITAAMLDDLVLSLTRRIGCTAIVVTHEMRSAFRLSDEILMLWRGRIHHHGEPATFIESDDPVINQFVQGRRDGPISDTGGRVSKATGSIDG